MSPYIKIIFKWVLLTLCLLGCVSSGVSKADPNKRSYVLIGVVVERYEENAEYFYYLNGTHSTIHITTLRVDSPKEYSGRTLKIFHPGYTDPESIWMAVGRSFNAVTYKSYLEDPEHRFDSQNMKIVHKSIK